MTALIELPATTPDAPKVGPELRERRRRLRRRLLLAGLVPLLAALAFSAKVGTMVWADREGRAAYGDGDFAAAQHQFESNGTLNLLEPWIAPYDEGTARYLLGDFAGAKGDLEEALGLAPSDEVCRVRINLSLTHEAIGDDLAAVRPLKALKAYRDGADTLAGGDCVAGSVGRAIDTRLQEKLARRPPTIDLTEPDEAAQRLGELNARAERLSRQAEQRQQDKADDAAAPFGELKPGDVPIYEW